MIVNKRHRGSLTYEVDKTGIGFWDILNDEGVAVVLHDDIVDIELIGNTRYPNSKTIVTFEDAKHKLIGSGIAKRDVYHFITKDHCTHLRAGLTVHHSLASSTPHTFELLPEPGFEELFWFRIANGGKALLEGDGLWPDGTPVNAAWPVRDGDIAQVPMGSHRVIALPDVDGNYPKVAYVWCYLAKHERWEKN